MGVSMASDRLHATVLAGVAIALTLPFLPQTSTGVPVHERALAGVGLFSSKVRPAERAVPDTRRSTLGVRFTSRRAGFVTAVQFFRSRPNTGRHKVKLYGPHGTVLGRGSSRSTHTGWVTVRLRKAVPIKAGKRYVAAYVAPHGRYSRTRKALPVTAHQLTARAGVRGHGRGMPAKASRTNYWVDVVFKPDRSTTPTPPPTGGVLPLPRIPWEGGSAYWTQFPKAHQSGWDQPGFFPISVFLGKPEHASQLKALGINTYMEAEHDGTPLTYITSRGMFVLAQQEEFTPAEVGTNPGVVGWFISDECEMGYSGCPEEEYASLAKEREYVAKVRAYNDGRFTQANFGNGVLDTWWAPNTMDDHVQLMDAASADKYTYTSPHIWGIVPDSPDWPDGATVRSAASYGWQVDQMKTFQDPQHLRPIWTFVETAMPLLDEAGAVSITPDQLEGAVWSAIIHEARGVAFFQHNNNGQCGNYSLIDCGPALQSKVTAVTRKIRELAPVINSQSYVYNFSNGTDTMLKADAANAYIFADIGLLESPGSKTFSLPPGVNGTSVTVVGENRTLPVTNGKFTDEFAAEYSHHVYKIAL
jgi:hypothetical protein